MRAGPRARTYFAPRQVRAAVVTCGGLCPGLNNVVREIVCSLETNYGAEQVYGILGGYSGFYAPQGAGWTELTAASEALEEEKNEIAERIFQTFAEHLDVEAFDLVRAIVAAVYAYVRRVLDAGPVAWIWQECAIESAQAFRFKSKPAPIGYVTTLSQNMCDPRRAPAHLLSGGHV